jgi:hypothetical protein
MGRPRSQYPPKTAAERQEKCRAIKRGEQWYTPSTVTPADPTAGRRMLPPPTGPSTPRPALPAPHTPSPAALPAPQTTALAKASAGNSLLARLPIAEDVSSDKATCLLPAAVAARLKSLLDRHHAGKTLTVAQQAEAEGLLDIAEYFAIQRMRKQIAA